MIISLVLQVVPNKFWCVARHLAIALTLQRGKMQQCLRRFYVGFTFSLFLHKFFFLKSDNLCCRHLVMNLPEGDRKKIIILTDCMSPVSKYHSHSLFTVISSISENLKLSDISFIWLTWCSQWKVIGTEAIAQAFFEDMKSFGAVCMTSPEFLRD